MTSGGAEALKAAIRRSLPLIIGLIVLGVVAVNAFKMIQGARYEADAKVLISTTPLSSIITGTEPSFVDPQRVQQTALGIAASPQVYELAVAETGGEYGDEGELDAATGVAGDPESDLITFTATSSNADEAVAIVNAVSASYIEFRDELSSSRISDTIEGMRSRLDALPAGGPEQADLQAQLSRLELLKDAPSEAELVQPATSADKTSPAPLRDSLVGFSIGLVIALLAVALREAINTTVRSESEVEEMLSAPVLASVRPLPRRTRMVTYGHHEARFADAYALLAAQLERSEKRGTGVLAVTSAIAQEGKTTTAANLAVAIARRGTRVILADFDFRKPSVGQVFNLPENSAGILQVMAGTSSLEGVMWSVSLEGARPQVSLNGKSPAMIADGNGDGVSEQIPGSLQLLPSGGVLPTRKVPQRSKLTELLRELRERADVVILDTPPALLTVEVAELAKLIDAVLVVVRQGRVSQRSLRALGRQSRTWSTTVAGVVMTDVQAESQYSYYGGN